ncbi:MAG TPA: quinolinate synthase NadA [Planctomycetota bacterium]|nr:quinolinate synthase NadA [Planctomycetota bacterium]
MPAGLMQDLALYEEIAELKEKRQAVILAHYYQDGAIQEIADFTGDSLKLAREAVKVTAPVIVFCGVHFMAETAKILNREKTVLLPDVTAGCSLADSCPAPALKKFQDELRAKNIKFQTVTYINSTAAVKALSDWIVTSGNAREIIDRVPSEYQILFTPDEHLGRYLMEETKRPFILWKGSCIVHEAFSVIDLLKLKKKHPKAITIAHPECPHNMLEQADYIGGTEGMLKFISGRSEPTEFLVATEVNMLWQFEKRFPQHTFHPIPGIACACNACPHMAKNTLEKMRDCLRDMKPQIEWHPDFDRAKEVIARSLLENQRAARD